MSLTLSSRGFCLSRTSISVLILSSSASFSKSRTFALILSGEEVFSSSISCLSSLILRLSSSASCSSLVQWFEGFFLLLSVHSGVGRAPQCHAEVGRLLLVSCLYCVMSFCSCDSCCFMVFFLASSALLSSLSFCIALCVQWAMGIFQFPLLLINISNFIGERVHVTAKFLFLISLLL